MKCFVIAMQKEAEPVLRAMEDKKSCGRAVVGELFGEKTGVIVCGVGKVNAAAGAQYAIDKLNADVIINLGTAGGLNSRTVTGNCYAVTHAVQFDIDLVQVNGGVQGTLDGLDEPYLPLCVPRGFELCKCATADRFNDSPQDFRLITETLGADVRDMECGAIAQVCIACGAVFYSFKFISDVAGSGSTTEQYKLNLKLCVKNIGERLESIFKCAEKKE